MTSTEHTSPRPGRAPQGGDRPVADLPTTVIEIPPAQRGGRRPQFDRDEASSLLSTELDRTLDLLRSLDDDAWATPVAECPGWDVRRMYLHVLGACEAARTGENMRQMRRAHRHRSRNGGPLEAALSHVQIVDRLDLEPSELVTRLEAVAPGTVRRRRRLPAPIRRVAIAVDGPVFERWTLGYLVDVIYLRDLWMHRIDATRATGADLVLTSDHDGRIVADVVSEWAGRHGRSFSLTLTGPAGGQFVSEGDPRRDGEHDTGGNADPIDESRPVEGGRPAGGDERSELELDAIEFCRILAGRGEATGLLTTIVPF